MGNTIKAIIKVPAPDLRIVPLDKVWRHEFHDRQRAEPLAQRLVHEGVLKNPPIVTPVDESEEQYLVLDGANRTTALAHMGYPHVLVQVVPYRPPEVVLTTWHHVIERIAPDDFIAGMAAIDGLEVAPSDLATAKESLAKRDAVSYTIDRTGCVYVARPSQAKPGIKERNRLLNALVQNYINQGKVSRTMEEELETVLRLYPDMSCFILFPSYRPKDVLTLVRAGELLPAGLTRHLIQGRALRINYPLSLLESGDPLDVKNVQLQEWFKDKMRARQVRFYGEMSYLFDE